MTCRLPTSFLLCAAVSITALGCSTPVPSVESVGPDAVAEPGIAELRHAMAHAPDEASMVAVIDSMARLGPASAPALDELVRLTGVRSDAIRSHAIRAIGHVARDETKVMPQLGRLLGDSSPEVVIQAAVAVGRIAGSRQRDSNRRDLASQEGVVQGLVAACSHADARVRKAAIESLLVINPDPAVLGPLVATTFRSTDPAVILPLLGTLADMGEAAMPLLARAFDDPQAAYWASVVVQELGPAAAIALPSLRRIVGNDSIGASERLQAILGIAAIGEAAKGAAPELIQCLATGEPSLRSAAAFAIGRLRSGAADDALNQASDDSDPAVSSMATWALARIHPDDKKLAAEAAGKLIGRLAEDDPVVRASVILALSELHGIISEDDDTRLAGMFAGFLASDDSAVSSAAFSALRQQGPLAVDALVAALKKPASRPLALEALSMLPHEAASMSAAIVPLLSDKSPAVAIGACLSLATAGASNEAGVVPGLARLLTNASNPSEVRCAAAYALGKIGPAAAAAAAELLATRETDDAILGVIANWAAAIVLPTDREVVDTTVEHLTSALQAPDETVRYAASVALGELGIRAVGAIEALQKVSAEDPAEAVQEAAQTAADRIRLPQKP